MRITITAHVEGTPEEGAQTVKAIADDVVNRQIRRIAQELEESYEVVLIFTNNAAELSATKGNLK